MEAIKAGFCYTVEIEKDGVVTTDKVYNLIPLEGLNHMILTWLKQGAQPAAYYIGLFEGNYNPVPGDVMASFPTDATELTAYDEATRQELVLGEPLAGMADNYASLAEFTGNTAGKQATGVFISTAPGKGATTGVLISAARLSTPRPLDAGSVVRVKANFTIASA